MKSLRKQAYRQVRKEFRQYRHLMFVHGGCKDLWQSAEKVLFYQTVMEFFLYNMEISEAHLQLAIKMPGIIQCLWQIYLSEEAYGFKTWSELERLLDEAQLKFCLTKSA